jgi:hypothetical protein
VANKIRMEAKIHEAILAQLERPWPDHHGKCAAIALEKAATLTRHRALQEVFAKLIAEAAAGWWALHVYPGSGRKPDAS